MKLTSRTFKTNAKAALENPILQSALQQLKSGLVAKRSTAKANLPEFETIRDTAVSIKNHTLEHLDYYLQQFENQVIKKGGQVHWARDGEEACQLIIDICSKAKARLITKNKSMVSEEIGLNHALEKKGFAVVETDLGEYILQQRDEPPSHIVLPAIHLIKNQIAKTFYEKHTSLNQSRDLSQSQQLLDEAHDILRDQFFAADVGITGGNVIIAESGMVVIVTNEGNADLTQTLAKTHIVVTGLEKVVPTFEDAMHIIRLLGRNATGQEITAYTTFVAGPKHAEDLDGPEEFHVVLVDNGRSKMLGSHFQDMLRCIRCGACLNHCPIYDSIGGQAYGSPYSGPMGAVLTPSLFGIKESRDLPNASTFCGRCEAVCPMRIPLPKMMRYYREEEYQQHLISLRSRLALKIWAFFAKKPKWYRLISAITVRILHFFGKEHGNIRAFPFLRNWTKYRDFPAPTGATFQQLWRKEKQHE